MSFDTEQWEAIQFTGSNIMVSASAGAGKTNVLVHRLLKRNIEDRIPLDRILALTFTKAAAAEMKNRLATSLHEEYQKAEDDELKKYLQNQLILLESAQITTIDSFCVTLIKKYCNVLGMDPSTADNVISDSVKWSYYKIAFQEVLQLYSNEHHEGILRILEFFSSRSEDYASLFEAIKKINEFADNSNDPDGWFIKARKNYQKIKYMIDLPEEILDSFFAFFQSCMNRIQEDLNRMEKFGEGDEKFKPDLLEVKKNACKNCLNALNDHNYSLFDTSFQNFCALKTSSNGNNKPYKEARDAVVKHANKIATVLYDEKTFIADHNENCDIAQTLFDLAQETKKRFLSLKQENACLDFSDMGRYVFEILKTNDGSTAKMIQDQFDEIMVDEFQDTSELQNTIIELISNGHNIFRVGDVKQSIYRFRQAKPDLMRSIRKDVNVKNITLKHNYRSKESIVQFTNLLFKKLMNIPGCKDEYSQDDIVEIGENTNQSEKEIPVEFTLIEDTRKIKWEDPTKRINNKTAKANWIAQKMISMKQEDPSISWSDFAVLFKSHADKAVLKSAFNRYGIPYAINAKEGFFNSELCLIVSAIVSYLMNRNDEIALLAICTSELFDLSDEECAQCKLEGNQILQKETDEKKKNRKPFTTGIDSRHKDILPFLNELKKVVEKEGIFEMMNVLAYKNQFYEKLDSSQQANWDFLMNTIVTSHITTLYDLQVLMEEGKDEESSEAMSTGKDDDVVKVETIHHSKGLQYQYVFLWSTSSQNSSDREGQLLIDGDGHVAFPHISFPYRIRRTTIEELALTDQTEKEVLEEFVRVLYVAVTRAVKRLFVVDTKQGEIHIKNVNLPLLQERKGFTNLLISVLEPSSLFQIQEISPEDLPQENANHQEKKYVRSLPHFQDEHVEFYPEILTPSSTEFNGLPPLDQTSTNVGSNFGTTVHKLLESLPKRTWTREDIGEVALPESYIQRILNFGNSDLYQKCLNMDIYKEMPFYVQEGNTCIEGTMDFVAIAEKEILLIDYKTDHATETEIQKRYSKQLNTYRKALELLYSGRNISVYAYSFHNEKAIKILE